MSAFKEWLMDLFRRRRASPTADSDVERVKAEAEEIRQRQRVLEAKAGIVRRGPWGHHAR